MVGPLERCCVCRKRASEGLAKVMQAVEESLALPLAEGPSRSLGRLHAKNIAGYNIEARHWHDGYHGWWDDAVKGNRARSRVAC